MFAVVAKLGDKQENLVRSGADFYFVDKGSKIPYVFETVEAAERALNVATRYILADSGRALKYTRAKFFVMEVSLSALSSRGLRG